jgi:hypothetical protein
VRTRAGRRAQPMERLSQVLEELLFRAVVFLRGTQPDQPHGRSGGALRASCWRSPPRSATTRTW